MHWIVATLMCLFTLTCQEAFDIAQALMADPSEAGYTNQADMIQAAKDRYEEVGCTTMGSCD